MLRVTGLIILAIVLFTSLFKLGGADLNNNVLAVALMVLLIVLFSDLKEFNFWGLWGKKKEEEKLKELKGEEAIAGKNLPKVTSAKLKKAYKLETVVTMDNDVSDFLALAFEIERLLRVAASVISQDEIKPDMQWGDVTKLLDKEGFFTDSGKEQIESIRWLRNMLVHGREHEVQASSIKDGLELAKDFYTELRHWLDAV